MVLGDSPKKILRPWAEVLKLEFNRLIRSSKQLIFSFLDQFFISNLAS